MKKLMLFDIDRTLVTGFDSDKYTSTINNLHNLDVEVRLDIHGLTDKLILGVLLEQEGWTDKQIETNMPHLLEELERVHKRSFQKGSMKLLPGVSELLNSLREKGVTLGLVTGNVQSVAKRKLEDVGIWQYFSAGGGFGNDPHAKRTDLIDVAIDKTGFANARNSVYIIGDTPRDISAAQEAGIRHSIGVANGFRKTQELIDAGAEIVLEDFKDTEKVLLKLNVA
jgi:phosphoglycolate phosphatase